MAFKDLRFHRPSQQQGVLVTGGTGGLGQETVRVLAENGCLVVFQYHRNEECASRLVADLKEKGLRVESIRFSLDGSSDYDAFMAEVEEKIGPPHAFIHCSAPEFELSRFEDNWLDVFNHMIVLNVKAFLKIANGCLGKMKYRQDGVVMGVLSESVMGDRVPQFSAYASAKMALEGSVFARGRFGCAGSGGPAWSVSHPECEAFANTLADRCSGCVQVSLADWN